MGLSRRLLDREVTETRREVWSHAGSGITHPHTSGGVSSNAPRALGLSDVLEPHPERWTGLGVLATAALATVWVWTVVSLGAP